MDGTEELIKGNTSSLLLFHIIQQEIQLFGFFTKVGDDCDRASDCFTNGSISIQLCETDPLSEFGSRFGHDDVDTGLLAQSLDKASVLVVVTALRENAQTSSSAVKCFGTPEKIEESLSTKDEEI